MALSPSDVEAWLSRGARAFPSVRVDQEIAARYVAARSSGGDVTSLDGEAGEEVYLLAALSARAPGADAAFEARYFAPIQVGAVRVAADALDEAKQRARAKLLVPDADGRMKVEAYGGQGKLAGLVRVVVTREAISMARSDAKEQPADEALADRAAEAWDPGVEALEGRARVAFREAFERAVTTRLTPRERTLLRLHLIGGVTLEKLAAMHGVHRATVVRWLAAARATILSETKKGISDAMQLHGTELESLMQAIESRLDVSVERMLATTPAT